MTISQVALSWVVNRDYITSAIIGVSSVAELEENMKVLSPEFRLTATEVNKKNALFLKINYEKKTNKNY